MNRGMLWLAAVVLIFAGLPADAASTAVRITDNKFGPRVLRVRPGTVVVWTNLGSNSHSVTEDDNSFDSGALNSGAVFSRSFALVGTIRYYCRYFGAPNGVGMAGVIQVTASGNIAQTGLPVAGQAAMALAVLLLGVAIRRVGIVPRS